MVRVFKLNRKVFSVKNNVHQFLNGLTSNMLDKPQNAFLNIHGRIIATFDQLQIRENEFLIAVESAYADEVLKHLERYIKLSGSLFAQTPMNVYFDLDNAVEVVKDDYVIEQKKGRLILTERDLKTSITEEEFTFFRLKNNIPMHGIDYKDDMLLNVSTTDHVSFTKGCFLGQEPVAKVYNRSKPTWRLVVKKFVDCTDEEKQKMTSKTQDPQTKEAFGFVFEKND